MRKMIVKRIETSGRNTVKAIGVREKTSAFGRATGKTSRPACAHYSGNTQNGRNDLTIQSVYDLGSAFGN